MPLYYIYLVVESMDFPGRGGKFSNGSVTAEGNLVCGDEKSTCYRANSSG